MSIYVYVCMCLHVKLNKTYVELLEFENKAVKLQAVKCLS